MVPTIDSQNVATQTGQLTSTIQPRSQQTTGDDGRLAELSADIARKKAAWQANIDRAEGPFRRHVISIAKAELEKLSMETAEGLLRRERHEQAAMIDAEQIRRDAAWRRLVERRGARYASCTFRNFQVAHEAQRSVLEALERYALDIADAVKEGRGIVLVGPSGTGKDHLLAALMRVAVTQDGLSIEWRAGPQLWSDLRDRITTGQRTESDILEPLLRADVLAISDPTAAGVALTEYQSQILYKVVDARYSARRPVWMTANVANREHLETLVGVPTTDRLIDGALILSCSWPSYRRPERTGRNSLEHCTP